MRRHHGSHAIVLRRLPLPAGIGLMDWTVVVIVCLVGLLAVFIGQRVLSRRVVTTIEKRIRGLDDFEPADVYVSKLNFAGVAIDVNRREILLSEVETFRRFTVPSIISCEILEDDVQLAYANRGSQLTGVAIGGILLGGVGAVIGGLSSSKRTVNKVKKIIIRFVTDDFEKPNHDIVLLDSMYDQNAVERSSSTYRKTLEIAELWHSRVRAMMKADQLGAGKTT